MPPPTAGAAVGRSAVVNPPPPKLGYRGQSRLAGGADDGGVIPADGVQDAGEGRMDLL